MPTYDYICLDCQKRFDVFLTYQEYGIKPVSCSRCGGSNIRRRAPRVRLLKGDEARLGALSDPAKFAGAENDPHVMAKMFREMGGALGEEMPPQFNEIVDRLDAGQSPEQIESAMPDWGGPLNETFEHDHSEHDHAHED